MKKNKNSIELKKINIIFLLFIFILCVLLIITSIGLILQFQRYAESTNQSTAISRAAIKLQEASDYLSEEARLFVLSGNPEHMDNYFLELNKHQRREQAISELKENTQNSKAIDYLEQALIESHNLELREYYAMKLVVEAKHFYNDPKVTVPDVVTQIHLYPEDAALNDEYKISKAWLIMFSEEYMDQKRTISDYKSKAMEEILDYSDEVLYKSYSALKNNFIKMIFCIGLIFVFNLGLFIVIIYFVIAPLYAHIRNIRSGNRLDNSKTKEFNILSDTFNEMFDKNAANELLLRHKAEHDELTGILNRSSFNQIKYVYLNSIEQISLIIIDIDKFKDINDTYGHSTGDMVLQRVANTLKDNFRTSDYVARIGGDEFVVVLTKCDDISATKKMIITKLEQIQKILAEKIENLPCVTLSCGIDFSSNGYNDRLYEHADAALYEVKKAGRNGFKFYSKEKEKNS